MYIILSPSKSQDFSRNFDINLDFKIPEFIKETEKLHKNLKKLSKKDLEKMMKISPKLAELNYERYQKWNKFFSNRKIESEEYNFSPAIFAFTGDVYSGFDLKKWKKNDFEFAQKYLGILSGFYGLISPLDFIKPYRLEMGVKFSFELDRVKYKNLYEFWNKKITEKILENLKDEMVLVNLASNEYFKVLDKKEILQKFEIIDIDFKIKKKDDLKIISIYAKKGRGEMANWIIKNKIKKVQDLKGFSEFGWSFLESESSKNKFVFVKEIG